MVNDTISDMLTRLRNGNLAYKANVSILNTKVNRKICVILEREGFIHKAEESANPNEFVVYLKYKRNPTQGIGGVGKPCITNLKRISKPGLRIYTNTNSRRNGDCDFIHLERIDDRSRSAGGPTWWRSGLHGLVIFVFSSLQRTSTW